MHDAGMEFSNYRFSTFRNLSSPSASNFRGQAMFRRMKSRPASPYIAPGFMRSFASSSSFVSSSSDVSPDARQSFFQAEDGIRDLIVTGVQTCALPICLDLSIM